MAYLEGLTFQPGNVGMTETRQGVPNYNGSASTLQEWKFKVTTKKFAVLAIKDEGQRSERLAELTSKVTDGLSGDALKVAMDLGEDLSKPGGLDQLVEQIEKYVLAFKEDEARELFHAGSKVDGPLARQKGESMVSYISRRNRWFNRLRSLDSETTVSQNILAITYWTVQVLQTSTN